MIPDTIVEMADQRRRRQAWREASLQCRAANSRGIRRRYAKILNAQHDYAQKREAQRRFGISGKRYRALSRGVRPAAS